MASAASEEVFAFAFQKSRRACHIYTALSQGDIKLSHTMGIYSSGLAVIPSQGFVSAFKTSSFPAAPLSHIRLRGRVTDITGAGITGAMIVLHWDRIASDLHLNSKIGTKEDLILKTDLEGNFVADVPPGYYDLLVSAAAFTPACRKLRIDGRSPSEVTVPLNLDPAITHYDPIEVGPPKPR